MNDFMSNLISGLSTTLIGMLIVFFGLLVLIVCITVMHKVMNPAKKQARVPEAEKVVVPPREAQPAEEEPEEDDGELIAVIAAAVDAVYGEKPHRIKAVKKARASRSAWSRAGVLDNTRPF